VSNGTGALAPKSHSIENAAAETTTDSPAARPLAATTPPALAGSSRRNSQNNAHPANEVTIAMLSTL
jgi:hypothetical protein